MIRAIFCDCDGVLTEGGMYYDKNGLAFKKFNTRDFAAVWRLKAAGLQWAVVTAADDEPTKRRIDAMNPDYAWYGTADKLAAVKKICAEMIGCELSEVAYLGDDHMDIPAMQVVGVSFCPADAAEAVLRIGACCIRKGGEGVFAEVVDRVIEENKQKRGTSPYVDGLSGLIQQAMGEVKLSKDAEQAIEKMGGANLNASNGCRRRGN